MKGFFVFLSLSFFSFCAEADVNPKVRLPIDLNINKFFTIEINKLSPIGYTRETSGCDDIIFKDYFFLKNVVSGDRSVPGNYPIKQWLCLFSSNVYEFGYDRSMAERIVYSKGSGLWVKENNNISDIVASDQKEPYKKLALYNVTAVDSKGYAVIDENITSNDRFVYGMPNLKKLISFCLIQDYTYIAFCGSGNLISNINGKDVDLTPYVLMSLESMKIGVNNPVNELMRKHPGKPMPE